MIKLTNILMLSCRRATGLADKKSFRRLTLIENLQLKMHFNICEGCRTYMKQAEILNKLLIRQKKVGDAKAENTNLKHRIISKIKT